MNTMLPANGAFTRTNSFGAGEARNYPEFFIDAVQDPIATAREGRAIFVDQEFVKIHAPGNPYNKPVHRVTDDDRALWPKEYEAFKKGVELAIDGTPLEQWPLLKKSQVLMLKSLGFYTVEQVAQMDDRAVQLVGMGARNLKNNAAAYLDVDTAAKLNTQLTAENDRKDAQIAALTNQVAELSKLVTTVHAQQQTVANAQPPAATVIPGLLDPVEQAKGGVATQTMGPPASFDNLPEPRKNKKGG